MDLESVTNDKSYNTVTLLGHRSSAGLIRDDLLRNRVPLLGDIPNHGRDSARPAEAR